MATTWKNLKDGVDGYWKPSSFPNRTSNSILKWVLVYKVSCNIGVNAHLCLIGVQHLYSYSIHTASLKVFVSQPV